MMTEITSVYFSTRFVVKPEGVSNEFLTIFDYFLGVNKNLGLEAPEFNPQPPDKSSTGVLNNCRFRKKCMLRVQSLICSAGRLTILSKLTTKQIFLANDYWDCLNQTQQ